MADSTGLAMATGGGSSLLNAAGPLLESIFGRKPDVAGFQDVILGDEQLRAILANLKAFQTGNIQQLGNLYQDYMLGAFNRAVPNFSELLKQGGAVTGQMITSAGQMLGGQVPQDVQDWLRRQTAFQNIGSGLYQGGAGAANFARNLGLTSLNMINQGANLFGQAGNAASRWAQIAGQTILPASSFLITPQEQFAATTQNRLIQRQIQQERNIVAASPNPVAKGLSDLVAYLTASYIGHGAAGQPPKAQEYSYLNQPVTANQGFGGGGAGSSWDQPSSSGGYGYGAQSVAVGPMEDVAYPGQPNYTYGGQNYGSAGFDYGLPYEGANTYGVTDFNVGSSNPAVNYGF